MDSFDTLFEESKKTPVEKKKESHKRSRPYDNTNDDNDRYDDRRHSRARRSRSPRWKREPTERQKGKFLVIIPAGNSSLHASDEKNIWYKHGFDICIVYYGTDEEVADTYRRNCRYFFQKRGPKWQLVRHAMHEIPWKSYEYIWLPDDDLRVNGKTILKMFQIASHYRIALGQPALLDVNIQKQYRPLLLAQERNALHFTNFVEIMCPFFRVDALEYLFYTFDTDVAKSGWGLDIIWPVLLHYNDIAVIDATPVEHTRPQNAFTANNSFYLEFKIDPQKECHDLMQRFRTHSFKRRVFNDIRLSELPTSLKEDLETNP